MRELPPAPRCPRCAQQGWPENCLEPPLCAFPEGVFVSKNWNCASMQILRTAAYGRVVYNDDQACAVLAMPERDEDDRLGSFIVLSWYKSRGRTESAMLYEPGDQDSEMKPLTLAAVDLFARKR